MYTNPSTDSVCDVASCSGCPPSSAASIRGNSTAYCGSGVQCRRNFANNCVLLPKRVNVLSLGKDGSVRFFRRSSLYTGSRPSSSARSAKWPSKTDSDRAATRLLGPKPASFNTSFHRAQKRPRQSDSLMPVSVKNARRPRGLPPFAAAVRLISWRMSSLLTVIFAWPNLM